jgi:hypothetical protein
MKDLEQVLAKLQFYPDLQQSIRDAARSVTKEATDTIIETIPVRLGYKRKAFELQKDILKNI